VVQLREEKIDLENTLEAESESHVNRLSRELSALRLAQQQQQQGSAGNALSPDARGGPQVADPGSPSSEIMLEAMRRENDQLRSRLVDTERDYIRISRLNEIYREELIEHRRRVSCIRLMFWIFNLCFAHRFIFVSLGCRWTT
jgi:hypothetical protein